MFPGSCLRGWGWSPIKIGLHRSLSVLHVPLGCANGDGCVLSRPGVFPRVSLVRDEVILNAMILDAGSGGRLFLLEGEVPRVIIKRLVFDRDAVVVLDHMRRRAILPN